MLSVLYPWADLKNNFHIDHMWPKSQFTAKKLEKRGIVNIADKDFYINNVNYIGNLQLLESVPNIEKKDKDCDVWLKSTYTDLKQREDYMQKHHIPDIDLSFGNFEQFFMEREKLIVQALESELI